MASHTPNVTFPSTVNGVTTLPIKQQGWFSEERIKKIMTVAAVVLLVSILSITIVTLIMKYPTASQIFYSLFSVTAAISFVALAIYAAKKCSPKSRESIKQLSSELKNIGNSASDTSSPTNPFQ